ncbi:MAG: NAD(P)-binding domain-containing protein [Bacteroidales bacterium]|nr:NAD(P)-binding domain-containing protein [Bacteroidales bacterium]
MKTISIIGAGHIGGAVARGLAAGLEGGAADIILTATREETLAPFRAEGFRTMTDNRAAAARADLLLLAVKPHIIPLVVREVASVLREDAVVGCLAPGVRPEDLQAFFGDKQPALLYVIPNTAAEIRQSVTFLSPVNVTEDQLAGVEALFACVGEVLVVPPHLLSAGTSVASCGIAYAMRYIRAAVEGAVELGLYPADALKAVCGTVQGAAGLLLARGTHPEAEIDKVTTPGGLTIRGLNAMEEAGFTNAVIRGLKAGAK